MPEPGSAPFEQLVRDALDGVGSVVRPNSAEELDALGDLARAAGLRVLEVKDDAAPRSFVFGPIWCALDELDPVADVPPVAVAGVSPRLVRWMLRMLEQRIIEQARREPILVLIHDLSILDPVARRFVDGVSANGLTPALWAAPVHERPASTLATPTLPEPDADARVLLELIAASEVALSIADLDELTGWAPGAAATTIDELARRGVLATCRGHVAIVHAEHRAALLSALPVSMAGSLRRGILDVLSARGMPPIPLAEVALGAVRPGDHAVIDMLSEAMHLLRSDDPGSAAAYGEAAIDALRDPSDLRTALAWELVPLLWQTSRIEDARRITHRVFAERGQAQAEAQTMLWLARAEDAPDRVIPLTERGLSLTGVEPSTRTSLLAVHLRALSTLGRGDEVDRLLPGALAEAARVGDDASLSRLQTCDSIRHFYRGDYTRAALLTAAADASWERSGADPAERVPEMIFGPHLGVEFGNPEGALAELDTLIVRFSERGQSVATQHLHAERSLALLTLGRLGEASDEAVLATSTSASVWSRSPGASDRLQAIALASRLKIALHRGDAGELEELRTLLADRVHAPLGSEAWNRMAWWSFLLDDAQGTTDPETRSVDPTALTPVSWLDPGDEVLIGRALLMHGWRDSAADLAEHARRRVERSGYHPLAVTLANHLTGLADWTRQPLFDAIEGWTRLGRPLFAAAAMSDTGAKLRDEGDVRGVALMESAHERLIALGAHRDAWRIRWSLRASGHLMATEQEGDGGSLTPTERRVVDRAVLGATVGRIADELMVSAHTVTTHLRHVYAKLGIHSRVELVEWARQQGLD